MPSWRLEEVFRFGENRLQDGEQEPGKLVARAVRTGEAVRAESCSVIGDAPLCSESRGFHACFQHFLSQGALL